MKLHLFAGLILAALLAVGGCSQKAPEAADVTAQAADIDKTADTAKAVTRETTSGPVHAVVSLRPEKPVLGDQIKLTLTVDAEQGVNFDMPEFGDQLGRFNIAGFRPTETVRGDGRLQKQQEYTLDVPRSGKLRLPSFLVEFSDSRDGSAPSEIHELLTEEITFEVASVLPEGNVTSELHAPIGELPELVFEEEKVVWPWAAGGIAAFLALAAAAFVLATRKKQIPALPPHVVALAALDNLENNGIPTNAQALNLWHFRLSNIVREYVEGQFSLHAPRLTTEEFFELVKSGDKLEGDDRAIICRFLQQSDRIKFSGCIPTKEESSAVLKDARLFVRKTMPSELPADESQAKSQQAKGGAA